MMTDTNADVALPTERRYTAAIAAQGDWSLDNILRDDKLLQSALMRHGISSVRIDWASPDADWSRFRYAVSRLRLQATSQSLRLKAPNE